MKYKAKTCQFCGDSFSPTGGRQKRCKNCREKYQRLYIKNWQKAHRQHLADYKREYLLDEQNHFKHLARLTANNYRYSGKLAKAKKCAVKGCKCTEDLQFHHVEYQGEWGAICCVTLCRKHHFEAHQKQKQKQKKAKKSSMQMRTVEG